MMKQLKFSIWQLLVLTAVIALVVWFYTRTPFDRRLADEVPLVARVQVNDQGNGSKYHWREVDVLRVVKNCTKAKIPKTLNVASVSWGSGLPVGVCTVYLERYNDASPQFGWKLYEDGGAADGYTHHDAVRRNGKIIELKQ